MQCFKKWWQERFESPSKAECYQGDRKRIKKIVNQSFGGSSRSQIGANRESSDKSKTVSSTSSAITAPLQSQNLKSIPSSPMTCRLRQQAKDLESIIAGSVSSSHSINVESEQINDGVDSIVSVLVDPDEFFENPDEIRLHKKSNAFIDEYVIVDLREVVAITNDSSTVFMNLGIKSRPSKVIKYQTTKFCSQPKKQQDHRHLLCNASYCNYGYGLFYGTPSLSLSQFPETFSYRTFYDYSEAQRCCRKVDGIRHVKSISSHNLCSSSGKSEEERDLLEKSLIKLTKPCAPKETFSVQKTFGLTDEGDIIVNIDHILEEKECDLLLARKVSIYRSVERGDAICEKHRIRRSLLVILKEFFFQLCHPRNKQTNGGPGESVAAYALTLAADSSSTFSRNIENFIACTKESREVAPQVVMRNMRQFMSGMKNYLVKHGEGNFQQEVFRARSRLKADEFLNLDTILEGVMHQLVVLPLKEYLYGLFVDFYTRTADIQLLVENVKYASARCATDFGIRPSVTPPSSTAMQHISLLIVKLQEAELPLEKLEYLLAIVNAIFETSTHPRGQPLGADDFLPLLVFIVAKCGFIGAEIEAEFMWCLLQQSLLNGEAGYYLTALCSAVHVLKTFMASEIDGTGSLDIRSSSQPACSSVLRVIIPDEYNGSLQTRTLPVRPHTTTREVCRTIAHKARITNPQDYGLFKLVDGEETLLMDNDCPQEARLAARGKHCMLAYKRIDAKIAWPTMTSN